MTTKAKTKRRRKRTAVVLGDSEMSGRIRDFKWEETPVGKPLVWTPSLKNTISLMMVNQFPMLLWWGKEYIQFYNDAYIPVLGTKHPWGLGKPVSVCWNEIWHVLQPLIDTPYNGGPATWMDDILLKLNRNNFVEETHFTIAYSPVPDPKARGKIGGVLATVKETTGEIISKRQMETLAKLGKTLSTTLSADDVFLQAATALRDNPFDIPFGFIHRITDEGVLLETTIGFEGERNDIQCPDETWTEFSKALKTNSITHFRNEGRWENLPMGAWDIATESMIHIPITEGNKTSAVITLGLNPYRKFDESYLNFIQVVADQVTLGVNKAKAYDDERKRAHLLEEIDRAKTIFFSNVSHEFRTPLTLILGTMEEALKEPRIVPANVERLTIAHKNAMRLLKLVNTLLDFSKIESGRQKARYAETDVVALTINLVSNFRSLLERADLGLLVSTDTAIPSLYVDAEMWEKIVFNLLSNAFKYTLKGNISLRLFAHSNHVVLQVEDTGIGIPAQELPHMFERFHRVENAMGRSYEGTGIGLSLTKELVKLQGGDIYVESTEGKGTTFTVTIPIGKDHLPAEQIISSSDRYGQLVTDSYIKDAISILESTSDDDTEPRPKSANAPSILIVDDNSDMRKHIRSLLEKEFNVFTAPNGLEALRVIREEDPDLVISDVMMPVMDGIQLLKTVKSDPATSNVPVILLTARAGEESRIDGYDTGADDYLVKPFAANELLSRIKAQLKITKKREVRERELEQKVAERTGELKQKNTELEETNKELESFNYVASHDLQEPLRKIQTFTHMIANDANKEEAVKKYLAKIQTSAQRMSELINSILVYARLPQSTEDFELTDLNATLENVKNDFELIITDRHAVIDSDKLPVIKATPLGMHQLFSNLISNALKFNDKNPVIKIESTLVDAPGFADKGVTSKFHKLTFTDNGIGFKREYRDQIFKLFQRLNTRSKYEGTGVGLSIVAKIVSRHRGYISADSVVGEGSTFTVWLPAIPVV
ncbi:MAG TPA: ATP-binding protein [Cyclobacteriaceae bacterium]|nr:ATP-binding protein [Cyclobacteriaceae bacterium]